MTDARRPSAQTCAVLTALAAHPTAWRYGYELGREVALQGGSLYPILMRLRDRGWLEAAWESEPDPGRPARHLYRLTPSGLAEVQELMTPRPATPSRQVLQPRRSW